MPFTFLFPVHMLAAILITSVLKKFRNLLAVLIGVAYTTAFTWLWITLFQIDTTGGVAVTAAGAGLLFIRGIRAGIGGGIRENFFYGIGLLFHIVSVYLTSRAPLLIPFQHVAVALALFYVLAGLPLANRWFLVQETQQKGSLKIIPGTVLRGNRVILAILLVSIVLLSFWRTLLDAIVYAAGQIADLIKRFLIWLATMKEGSGIPDGGEQDMEMLPAQTNSIINVILDIITYLVILTIAFFIVRYFVKNFRRIFASFFSFLSGLFSRFRKWSSIEQGYVDKQESLLKTETRRRRLFLTKLFGREPRWRDMKDNSSRVRFLYTRFVLESIRRGFRFMSSETADETIRRIQSWEKGEKGDHSTLRNAYHLARYGRAEIDDETVKTLKDAYH